MIGENMVSLDDIVMWESYERPIHIRSIKKWFIVLTILTIGFCFMLVSSYVRESVIPVVTLCFLGILSCSWMYRIHIWTKKDRKFRKALEEKVDKVPIGIVNLALQQEKNYWTALLWAVECYESHIPGDCPLCGAK